MKNKKIWKVIGICGLCLILLISGTFFVYQKKYEQGMSYLLYPPSVTYKSETFSGALGADIYVPLSCLDKKLYFGELPQESTAIRIEVYGKFEMYLFPYTQDSILVDYQPVKGWNSQFELVGSSFNSYLKILYQLTGNEVFNETLDLPAVQR